MPEFADIKLWILNRLKLFFAALLLLIVSLAVIYYSHQQFSRRSDRLKIVRAEKYKEHKHLKKEVVSVRGLKNNLLVPHPIFEQIIRPRLPVIADLGQPVSEFEPQQPALELELPPSRKGPE
jgi:hypothetical protein